MQSLARATSRLAALILALAAAGSLAWSPAQAATGQADQYGPGYAIPDSQGNPGTSHIGAYGPPGLAIYGSTETYCADPERSGPDTAGGYQDPVTADHWVSSVTGQQVSDSDLANAAYVMSRYGQTQDAPQAAAVDAAVYTWLAGGTYSIDGTRGAQRLSYPNVSPTATTLARGYIAEASKLAGPYTLTLTPTATTTGAGQPLTVGVHVTASSGTDVPGARVELSAAEPGTTTATAQVTTDQNGTATWTYTPKDAGAATLQATATGLPSTTVRVLNPVHATAQRMLLAGPPATAHATAAVTVTPATGGIEIRKKDPSGAAVTGATFQLLDPATGKTVATGTTGTNGKLDFDGLTPGTYRLHETDTGSAALALAPDQDVTITAGTTAAANPLTITDGYQHGTLLLKKTDQDTGRPLPGAVVTISADTIDATGTHHPGRTIATLTTGADGTATLDLPVTSPTGTIYWARETTAPAGYQLDPTARRFTAKPGAQVRVVLTDTLRPATTTPSPPQTTTPATAPVAQLAHTGTSANAPWLAGAAGVLVTAGGGTVWAASRRRRTGR
jgi:hypothetical protein